MDLQILNYTFQHTHPRMGSDFDKLVDDDDHYISIHAPARGATKLSDLPATVDEFQSTLPHGERLTLMVQIT